MLLGVGGEGGQGDEGLASLVGAHDPLLEGGGGEMSGNGEMLANVETKLPGSRGQECRTC